ncbi:hypothetical protein L5515_006847 [Caenorhabditis briggsae]|nr:hypothetical protein L5515_006847 [Caenorhabditis briggsae]
MIKAIDAKENIDAMKADFSIMAAEAKSANSLSADDKKNLEELAGASLDKMFTGLNSWKSEVKGLTFTNISSYGQVFSKAKKVPAINLDVAKIRKSLKKLIDEVTDSTKKDKLKKVKDGLDSLDGMGMQFASYAKSFDGTSSALGLLEEFFSSFTESISETSQQFIPASNTNDQKSEKDSTQKKVAIICGSVVGVVFIMAICFVLYLCYCYELPENRRQKEKTVNVTVKQFVQSGELQTILMTNEKGSNYLGSLRQILAKQAGLDMVSFKAKDKKTIAKFYENFKKTFVAWGTKIFNAADEDLAENKKTKDVNDVSPFVQQHENETQHLIELVLETRVTVPTVVDEKRPASKLITFVTDFCHANYIPFKNNFRLILCQGPLKEKIVKGIKKLSTIVKFWFMVYEHNASAILMVCKLIEEGEQKCDKYYPENLNDVVVHGPFTIKCIKIATEDEVVHRTFELTVEGQPPRFLSHFNYVGWPDKSVPANATALVKYWKAMRCNPQGGIVHCSAGIGRSGTIAYVETLYQEIYYADNGKVAHQLVFSNLRQSRARVVQTVDQFLFSHYAVIELIVDTVGESNLNAYDKEFVLAVRAAWAEHVAEIEQAKKNATAKKAEEAAKKGKK